MLDGLQTQQRLYDSHIQHFRNRLPESGQLVDAKVVTLPKGELFFKNYFLAREYEDLETEGQEIRGNTSYAVEAYPFQYNVAELMMNSSTTSESKEQKIKLHEEILLTSATFAKHRLVEMSYATAYTTSAFNIKPTSFGVINATSHVERPRDANLRKKTESLDPATTAEYGTVVL